MKRSETTEMPLQLLITEADARSFMNELDAAITTVQRQAIANKRDGVLVTRNGYRSFIIQLTPEVPYGTTRELSLW